MELLEVMCRRRSVRAYSGQPLPEELLRSVLEAGLLSPSSRNRKPVELIAVRDRETLRRLAGAKTSGAGMLSSADCAVVVIGDHEKSDVWVEDCALSMSYMQLRAVELGAASCWAQCRNRTAALAEDGAQIPSDGYVKALLGIPERYSVLAILALGMPAEQIVPHTPEEADFKRVHRERF